jgi:hypothetical protein
MRARDSRFALLSANLLVELLNAVASAPGNAASVPVSITELELNWLPNTANTVGHVVTYEAVSLSREADPEKGKPTNPTY